MSASSTAIANLGLWQSSDQQARHRVARIASALAPWKDHSLLATPQRACTDAANHRLAGGQSLSLGREIPLHAAAARCQSPTTCIAGGMRKAPERGHVGEPIGYSNNSPWSWARSFCSWFWMYSLIIRSSSPTVLTQYPRAQNVRPNNVPWVFINSR